MSRKKQYNRTDARAAKRDRFVASSEQKPVLRPAEGTDAPASSAVTVEATTQLITAATTGHAPYPQVVAEEGAVRFSLATFDDYKAHYYTYMHEDQPVEFFILKSKDRVVRAAFNACDVCFEAKKGYRQDGDVMVCNNCGRRFPANQINVVQGGCNPSPLQRTVEGDSLVIQVEDLVEGLRFF